MPTSLVALQILLILLPGFAAAYVVQLLALRAPQTDLDKVIEATLYSFLIYAVFMIATHGNLPFDILPAREPAAQLTIRWHVWQLIWLAGITFAFALAGSVYVNRDGNRLFRKLGVTERTARRSIWNDIFQKEASSSQVVQVELADKRSIIGVLSYYSDSSEECSLYIKQAKWVGSDGSTVDIPGPGILITKNANVQNISLLDS